ncbi:MAG: Spy/CpxP family protein refolding chaperone [Acidobacteriota bacterium]
MKKPIAAIFAAIALAASMASAGPGFPGQPPPGGFPGIGPPGAPGGGPGDHMVELLTRVLSLTEKQQSAWKQIRTQTEKTIDPLATQLRGIHESIRTKLESGNAEPADVGQLMIDAHSIEAQIRSATDAGKESFAAILTEDQRAKLALFEEIMELMRPAPGLAGPPAHPR